MTRWLIGSGAALALSVDGADSFTADAPYIIGALAFLLLVLLPVAYWHSLNSTGLGQTLPQPTKRTAATLPPPRMRDDLMQRSENLLALSNQLRREAYELRDIAMKQEES